MNPPRQSPGANGPARLPLSGGANLPLDELLAVVKAARALQAELDDFKPQRAFMTINRGDLRDAIANLDARN